MLPSLNRNNPRTNEHTQTEIDMQASFFQAMEKVMESILNNFVRLNQSVSQNF